MMSHTRPGYRVQFSRLQSQILGFFLEINFFRIAAGTLKAETLVSGKAECSLAASEYKESKLFGKTFSFNNLYGKKIIKSLHTCVRMSHWPTRPELILVSVE